MVISVFETADCTGALLQWQVPELQVRNYYLFQFPEPLVIPELGSKLLVVPVFETTISS
jgi:hypothetical protein